MHRITINHLTKYYDDTTIKNVSFTLERGQILCLLGPSGCGKTTLLRLIAGLEQPDSGTIIFDGQDFTNLSPEKRRFGLMFQEFALFPHKNVFKNVSFGLDMQNLSKHEISERTWEMLALVGMTELAYRNVADLSGGERQRTALARSLAPKPCLLMLDEPLGSLDRNLRENLLTEIHAILKQLNMPTIFVTHDQSEAFAIADTIAVMHKGEIVQIDRPEAIYMSPKTEFIARFLGFHNVLHGKVIDDNTIETEHHVFKHLTINLPAGTSVTVILRPEGMLRHNILEPSCNSIKGKVIQMMFTGPAYRIYLKTVYDALLMFDMLNGQKLPTIGEMIAVKIHPSGITAIPD